MSERENPHRSRDASGKPDYDRLDDVLIAQWLGWTDINDPDEYSDHSRWGIPPGNAGISRFGASPFEPIPYYTTDIRAAWAVIERLREQGYHIDIGSTVRGSLEDIRNRVKHGQWTIAIRGTHERARADTLPLAVSALVKRMDDQQQPTLPSMRS